MEILNNYENFEPDFLKFVEDFSNSDLFLSLETPPELDFQKMVDAQNIVCPWLRKAFFVVGSKHIYPFWLGAIPT